MTMNNILIVEDDSLISGDIEATLKRLGHGVSAVVASGEEALRSAAVHRPDLALMDIKLKGKMDGIKTAELLRVRFKTPIIYLTSHTDDATLKRTKYTEPYGYIVKPFTEDTLRTTIEMAAHKSLVDEDLRASEARFRQMSDSLPLMAWMAQADRAGAYFNPAWLKFTGRSFGEEQGQGWMRSVHRGDLERLSQIYKTAFEARQPYRMEYRLRRHDGVYRWVEEQGVPLFTPENVFEGYIGACTDIHDLKSAQQNLEALLAERTQELARAQEGNLAPAVTEQPIAPPSAAKKV